MGNQLFDIQQLNRSRNSINTAIALVDNLTDQNKQSAIKDDLKTLHNALVEISHDRANESTLTKVPVIGKFIKDIRVKSYGSMILKSKDLINELSLELGKKCQNLKDDDRKLETAIVAIEKDLEINNKSYEKMVSVLEAIPGDEDSELSASEKASLVKICADVGDLIKCQSVQVANMKELKIQNMTVIRAMEHSIDKALISITTSIMISQHLEKRRELLELTNVCSAAAGNMLVANANEISRQTDEFHAFLASNGVDHDKVLDAINITKETSDKVVNFNTNVLPTLLDKLKANVETINTIRDVMSNQNLNVEKINMLINSRTSKKDKSAELAME